jgi:hypothetical protein
MKALDILLVVFFACLALVPYAAGATTLRIDVEGVAHRAAATPVRLWSGGSYELAIGTITGVRATDVSKDFRTITEVPALKSVLTASQSVTGHLEIDMSAPRARIVSCAGLLAPFCAPDYRFDGFQSRVAYDLASGSVDIVNACGFCGIHELTNSSYRMAYEVIGWSYLVGDVEYYSGEIFGVSGVFLNVELTSLRATHTQPTVVPLPGSLGLLLGGATLLVGFSRWPRRAWRA